MDKKILKQLYETFSREVYLYLYSLCHNHALAEDLMQETFLKAMLTLSESHGNMRAWLYMVARNLFLNHAKRTSRQLSYLETEPVSEDISLLDYIWENEKKRYLYLAMNQLDIKKREVLILQYFGGLSQKEIAAALHLTPENVRILAYRARCELKKYMEDHYDIS